MPDDPPDEETRRPPVAEPVSSDREISDDTGPEMDRLPPPAFPPASGEARRRRVRPTRGSAVRPDESGEDEGVPFDAFISPDDPIRRKARGVPDDAYISPDDPVIPAERDAEGRVRRPPPEKTSEVPARRPDRERPTLHELPYLLDQLAERLHDVGERALDVHPGTGHFQAALRSFLRGYLQGSRGGGE